MSRSSVPHCSVSPTLAGASAPARDAKVVVVVGSRPPKKDAPWEAWDRWLRLERACIDFVSTLPAGTVVVSGGARGIDQLAESTGWVVGHDVHSYRPTQLPASPIWRVVRWTNPDGVGQEWLPLDFPSFAAAALWRNGEMVRAADGVKAFWDGHSRGTADTIRKARAAGKLLP
jgi:hypothetical protein